VALRFDNSIVTEIQQAVNIADVISEHLSLKTRGKELVGLCPFHEDHRPSLYVNPAKQIFKCFACGAGGDVIKFVQLRENLSFSQALERLAQRAGIKIERYSRPRSQAADSQDQADPTQLARVNAWAANFWRTNLYDNKKGQDARKYIAGRQISPESAKKWGLGLALDAWDALVNAAATAGFSPKLLQQAGLAVPRENAQGCYDKFRNRLMFPISDVTGTVIGFGGRALGDEPAKYMNSPATALFDKSNAVYGLDQARHNIVSSGTAVVVEGYTDCIMAHQHGCDNVVATLGTSLTVGHARLLRRYAKQIVLVFDSDTAGIEAASRALEICLAERIDIRLVSLPKGSDPCDFLLQEGGKRFKELIAQAVDVMEFKWKRLTDKLEKNDTFVDKRAAIEEYLRTVAIAMKAGRLDAITKGLTVNRLSRIMGISSRQINAELTRTFARSAVETGYKPENRKTAGPRLGDGFYARAQQEVLEVLLSQAELFDNAKQHIRLDTFDVPIFRQIAEALFESLQENTRSSLRDILSRVESVETANVITDLAASGEKKGNFSTRLKKALNAIQEHQEILSRTQIRTIDDETESLRRLKSKLERPNLRNAGMV
jgi:DNA primase